MTHAELLRSHADLAIKEGGMYYSGEYLSRIATVAESLEAENSRLRELVQDMMRFFEDGDWCDKCDHSRECDSQEQYEDDCLMRLVFRDRMAQLRIEGGRVS